MNWSEMFLVCLAIGFVLSLFSVVPGATHFSHFHIHWHGAGVGHKGLPAFNVGTIAAFLLWFGGGGYLIVRLSTWPLWGILALAVGSGLVGSFLIFWFLARVLAPGDKPLDPMDYDMTGVLGQISAAAQSGGTGEMIFSQQGRRCGAAVRSESGEPLERGTEVVVTRYERGIAYVRTWDEMQKL